ncbi:MAG: thiamine-monophosphate kinase [Planctomycetes bacterium]|nr:thiamine-monophosphate kinase [Planctomycetota bacterium]
MGEFDYIRWIRQQTAAAARVPVGPGDDCAAVTALAGRPILVTTDMLLDGTHFVLSEAGPRRVGRKAMAVNLSDIAAMGGSPFAAFVSVGLPRGRAAELAAELYVGMRELADGFGVTIAGGDTNTWAGGLVVSVTLLGDPGPQGPILRNGAKPGDWLLVTGPLGGSILGKHLDFVPRVREALALQDHARIHAMIDISDGLAADTLHVCEESGCGAVLFGDQVPVADAAHSLTDGKTPLEHALSDGEDFELAFAVDPADGARLVKTQPIPGLTLFHVATFLGEAGLFLETGGSRSSIKPGGYSHPF